MNICYLTTEWHRDGIYGGIGSYVRDLSNELINKNNTITVVVRSEVANYEYEENGIKIFGIKTKESRVFIKNIISSYKIYKKIRDLSSLGKFDVIEVPEYCGVGYFTVKYMKNVIVRLHCPSFLLKKFKKNSFIDSLKYIIRGIGFMEKGIINNATTITSPSEALWKEVAKDKDVKVIPNPISIIPLREKKLNLEGKLNLLFVGKVSKIKGIDTLIEALGLLEEKVLNNIEIKIIGPGNESIIKEELLKVEYSKRKILERVIKIIGKVPRDNIFSYYYQSDVLIVPSKFENFPYVMLEGMLANNYIVARDVGGMTEIINKSQNNKLFSTSYELAQIVKELAINKSICNNVGEKNRKFVINTYGMNVIINKMIEEYKLLEGV